MDVCSGRVRLDTLDVLKGTVITAIVFVHLLIARDSRDGGDPSLFLQYFYLGLMFFFICSGYFYRPERGFSRNIKRRLVQLLVSLSICGVVLSVILFLEAAILWDVPPWEDLMQALRRAFCLEDIGKPMDDTMICPVSGASMGYYFVWTMFWSFLLFYSSMKYLDDDNRKIIAAIVVLLVIQALFVEFLDVQVPFFFNLAPFGAALMMAGRIMAKHSVFQWIEECPKNTRAFWLVLIGCAVSALILVIIFEPGISWDRMIYGEYGGASVFPFFVEAVLVNIALVYLAMLFGKIPLLSKMLLMAGKHTLGLLLLHSFFAKFIFMLFNEPQTGMNTWFPDTGFTVNLIVALVTYIITLAFCEIGTRKMRAARARTPEPGKV